MTLVEQPIMLEGPTIMAKVSRKESKKIKKNALDKFVKKFKGAFMPP